jgi:hypothetical protein
MRPMTILFHVSIITAPAITTHKKIEAIISIFSNLEENDMYNNHGSPISQPN